MVVGLSCMLIVLFSGYEKQGDWWLLLILIFVIVFLAIFIDDLLSTLRIEKDQHSLFLTYKTYFPFKKSKKFKLKNINSVFKEASRTEYRGNVLYSYDVMLKLKGNQTESLITARDENEADRIIKLIQRNI